MNKQESDYLEAEGDYMLRKLELDQALERLCHPHKVTWSEYWPLAVILASITILTPFMFWIMAYAFVHWL